MFHYQIVGKNYFFNEPCIVSGELKSHMDWLRFVINHVHAMHQVQNKQGGDDSERKHQVSIMA